MGQDATGAWGTIVRYPLAYDMDPWLGKRKNALALLRYLFRSRDYDTDEVPARATTTAIIADHLGISRQRVGEARKELTHRGWIDAHQSGCVWSVRLCTKNVQVHENRAEVHENRAEVHENRVNECTKIVSKVNENRSPQTPIKESRVCQEREREEPRENTHTPTPEPLTPDTPLHQVPHQAICDMVTEHTRRQKCGAWAKGMWLTNAGCAPLWSSMRETATWGQFQKALSGVEYDKTMGPQYLLTAISDALDDTTTAPTSERAARALDGYRRLAAASGVPIETLILNDSRHDLIPLLEASK